MIQRWTYVRRGRYPSSSTSNVLLWGREISCTSISPQRLNENAWMAVMETLLAMTIFRGEFTGRFLLLFGVLLGMKACHWIAKERVDSVRCS